MCFITIIRWVVNALVLMLITYVVPGFLVENFYTALVVALVLALVNAFIRPIVLILTLPVNILTLGLFTLIVNGFMFWIVSSIVKGFTITNFWSAVLAAIIYSLISMLISYLNREDDPKVKVIK